MTTVTTVISSNTKSSSVVDTSTVMLVDGHCYRHSDGSSARHQHLYCDGEDDYSTNGPSRRNRYGQRTMTSLSPSLRMMAMALVVVLTMTDRTTLAFPISQTATKATTTRTSRNSNGRSVHPRFMTFADVSEFYQTYPLQSAVLTCGFKASIADGIAQVRTAWTERDEDEEEQEGYYYNYLGCDDGTIQEGSGSTTSNNNKNTDKNKRSVLDRTMNKMARIWDVISENVEFRRNLAYVLYGGIFVGLMCHLEYNYLFPYLFGPEEVQPLLDGETVTTALDLKLVAEKVIFDDFISAPLMWLPPAYFIKALVYDYSMREGLERYIHDIRHNDLLQRYWTIWIPAQTISFSVIPDHFRVAFMASVSFFWFILFSTVSSQSDKEDITTTATATTTATSGDA